MTKIKQKILDNKRISQEEAIYLYSNCHLLELAELANYKKEKLYNRNIFYIVNQHINYTNICSIRCPLCAFSKNENDKEAYLLSVEQIISKVSKNVSEFHIVGGINNKLNLEYFTELFYRLKKEVPSACIKALTPVEIHFLSLKENRSYAEILSKLKESGLDMMPGGGAEIFNPKIRKIISPNKISGDEWLQIMKQAHLLGIPSNATMLYGHLEKLEDIIDHLNQLRQLQDQTNGFLAFVPLSFHPKGTRLDSINPSTAFKDLKIIAISRLFLDNIPHIKAYWIMLSAKLAQISLCFGADDIDGTIKEEKIFHSAGSDSVTSLTESEIQYLIKSAYKIPNKRDSFYNIMF
mgnify:CR=1 FL=1